jgi:hypothetical protein
MTPRKLLLVGLVLAGFAICVTTAVAQPLALTVGSTQGPPAKEVEIDIGMKHSGVIKALQFALTYDAAVLEAKQVTRGPLASGAELAFDAKTPGSLGMALAAPDGAKGEGVILKVRFLVKGKNGEKSALKIENARAWETSKKEHGEAHAHLDVIVNATPGEFTVGDVAEAGGDKSNLWMYILGGAGGLLLLLLVVFGLARKGNASRS